MKMFIVVIEHVDNNESLCHEHLPKLSNKTIQDVDEGSMGVGGFTRCTCPISSQAFLLI